MSFLADYLADLVLFVCDPLLHIWPNDLHLHHWQLFPKQCPLLLYLLHQSSFWVRMSTVKLLQYSHINIPAMMTSNSSITSLLIDYYCAPPSVHVHTLWSAQTFKGQVGPEMIFRLWSGFLSWRTTDLSDFPAGFVLLLSETYLWGTLHERHGQCDGDGHLKERGIHRQLANLIGFILPTNLDFHFWPIALAD